jgi:hypothetical protein
MTQTFPSKIDAKLNYLYDKLDKLGDLRDRGYPVPASDVSLVKEQIRLLKECI